MVAGCLSLDAQVKVIAHRGYWKAPESAQNSVAGLLKADEIGAYGSEFDVWMSREGKLYVNHDRRFRGVDIYKNTYSRICKVRLKNGERIPLLNHFLKSAEEETDIRLILEMKSLPTAEEERLAAELIVDEVRRCNLLDRTDFIAFSMNACKTFRRLLPDARVFYLGGDVCPQEIKSLGLSGIDYAAHVLKRHPEWVQEAHRLGLEVNVWTVNRKRNMRRFIRMGVDYITTDRPDILLKLLCE